MHHDCRAGLAEEGHEYYVDTETGETTWTKPVDLAWVQADSKEHGRDYFHNTITKVMLLR